MGKSPVTLAPSKDMAIGVAGIAAVALVLLWIFKQQAKEAAKLAGGVLSGENALTEGTPYAGAGIAGTLGAGANVLSGGVLERFGSWLGSAAWDITHKNPAP